MTCVGRKRIAARFSNGNACGTASVLMVRIKRALRKSQSNASFPRLSVNFSLYIVIGSVKITL